MVRSALGHTSSRCVQQLSFAYGKDMERKILTVQIEKDHPQYNVKRKSSTFFKKKADAVHEYSRKWLFSLTFHELFCSECVYCLLLYWKKGFCCL